MATRYFKSGATTWNSANNWSATGSGGVDNAGVPGSGDDVIFETGSGNCQINVNAQCRSLDQTSGTGDYGGTITYDTNARTLTIGDGTAGANNVALKFSAGSTYTISGTGNVITFAQTHSTQQTITWAGKATGNVAFSGSSGTPSRQFTDGLTATSATLTLNRGTLDINSQTLSLSQITISGTTARTLTLGSASITLAGASGAWSAATVTNLTVTANTATVTLTGSNPAFNSGILDYNGLSLVYTGAGTASVPSGCTFANLTRTGTAVVGDNLRFGGDCTITGTLTMNGNSDVNRLLVFSNSQGTARTVSAGTVVASYIDVSDITAAGAASWDLSAITGLSGDALGNTGITFTTPATQTYAGGTSSWGVAASWTSRIPLPQDDVIINTTTAGTLTVNMPRLGKNIDFTSYTRTFTLSMNADMYGNLTMVAGMTPSGSNSLIFAGRGSHTITTNGRTVPWIFNVDAVTGTYTLQDDLTNTRNAATAFTMSSGTFDANDKNVSITAASGGFRMTAGTVNMGNGTWTVQGSNAGAKWNVTGGTINAGGSTILMGGNGAVTKTFIGGGQTYNKLSSITSNVALILAIEDSNTFSEIERSDPTIAGAITFQAGTNTTITTVDIFGVSGQLMGFRSDTGGSPATITSSTPGNIGANSVSVSGNTGVTVAAGTLMDYLSMQDITWTYVPPASTTKTLAALGVG